MSKHDTLYEIDFVAWADETARLLRARAFSKLDLDALIEEVESLARVDRKAIRTQLERLLHHLLKWRYDCASRSRAGRGWIVTTNNARDEIEALIEDSPSLWSYPAEILDRVYAKAREKAADGTGLPLDAFPDTCPWPIATLLQRGWLPDAPDPCPNPNP